VAPTAHDRSPIDVRAMPAPGLHLACTWPAPGPHLARLGPRVARTWARTWGPYLGPYLGPAPGPCPPALPWVGAWRTARPWSRGPKTVRHVDP